MDTANLILKHKVQKKEQFQEKEFLFFSEVQPILANYSCVVTSKIWKKVFVQNKAAVELKLESKKNGPQNMNISANILILWAQYLKWKMLLIHEI